MLDCTVNPLKSYASYCRSIEIDWRAKECGGWYLCSEAIREIISVLTRPTSGLKRAADESFITCNAREAPVIFREDRLLTTSEADSTAEATGVQLDKAVLVSSDNVFEGGDDRDDRHTEAILDLQGFSDHSARDVQAFQEIKSFCEKEGLDVQDTLLEAQKLIVQVLATISKYSVLSAALIFGSDAFKLENKLLEKQNDELQAELASRQDSKLDGSLAELQQTYDSEMCAFQKKLYDCDLATESVQPQ